MFLSGIFGKNYRKQFKQVEFESVGLQQKQLARILKLNSGSGFGQEHNFKSIKTQEQFAENVPLMNYEDVAKYLEKSKGANNVKGLTSAHVRWFAQTSGTTSRKKKIPVSREFVKQNHHYVSKLALFNMINNFGFLWIVGGKNISMAGYRYNEIYKGLDVMDISALLQEELPVLYKIVNFPNKTFENWEEKQQFLIESPRRIGRASMISGVPTWVLSLFSNLEKEFGDDIKNILRNLRLFVHGGVNFQSYKKVFTDLFNDRDFVFFECYNASEGFYAFQYKKDEPALLLITNAGIYYEFRPIDEKQAIPLKEIETGEKYEMIITSLDGFYRYRTGDVVVFTSKNPFLLTITGRTTEFINAFGEDLALVHVNKVLGNIHNELTFSIKDFLIVPKYPDINEKGKHQWFIEFKREPDDLNLFADRLDEHLMAINNNYDQKRYNGVALDRLEIISLPNGTFEKLLKNRGKVGGQIKMKKLHNDRDVLKDLDKVME